MKYILGTIVGTLMVIAVLIKMEIIQDPTGVINNPECVVQVKPDNLDTDVDAKVAEVKAESAPATGKCGEGK